MGIFRDIWMRIKGIKLIPKEAEPNNFVMPENSMNQYSVDPSIKEVIIFYNNFFFVQIDNNNSITPKKSGIKVQKQIRNNS